MIALTTFTELLCRLPAATELLATAAGVGADAASNQAAPEPSPSFLENIHTEPINPVGFIAVAGGLFVGFTIAMTAIISGVIAAKNREQSRREIAAYVAEGSISPEDAERLIKAKPGE